MMSDVKGRQALALHQQGLKFSEIAENLGVSVPTARQRVYHAEHSARSGAATVFDWLDSRSANALKNSGIMNDLELFQAVEAGKVSVDDKGLFIGGKRVPGIGSNGLLAIRKFMAG